MSQSVRPLQMAWLVHADLRPVLGLAVAQAETPHRRCVEGERVWDGVVDARDRLDKALKGTLGLARELPVQEAVGLDELQAQLRVLGKEVRVAVAQVLQRLLQRENRRVKGARAADPPLRRNGLEKVGKSQRNFSL